jgi:hypothetical protein
MGDGEGCCAGIGGEMNVDAIRVMKKRAAK